MSTNSCLGRNIKTMALASALLFGVRGLRADDELDPTVEKQRAIAEARENQIATELATLDRAKLSGDDWAKEWAGIYYTGDGLGMNVHISIAPKSGVAYTWRGCLGLYAANYGDIVESSPVGIKVKLALDPEKPEKGEFKFMSSSLYFVRWGDRRYLVPEREMLTLVVNYNCGGWTRDGMFGIPLRAEPKNGDDQGRQDIGPPGRPQLPADFAKLIIEKPTRLKITSAKITDQRKISGTEILDVKGAVELDGGHDRGLFVGTDIDCTQGERHGSIRLTKVDAAKSWGAFDLTLYDKSAPPLKPGAEVVLPGAKPDVPAARSSPPPRQKAALRRG